MPQSNLKSKKSFTLIELLVVISIIAILVAVAIVSYSNIQMKGRDAKRKANLATVQQALEQFYADNGAYPLSKRNYNGNTPAPDNSGSGLHKGKIDSIACETGPVATNNTSILTGLAWGTDAFTCNGKTYMNKLPDDIYPLTDANPDPNDHGYVYAIYYYQYQNAVNYFNSPGLGPGAPKGWCKEVSYSGNRTLSGSVATVTSCQQYTLWTTLENPNDPDIQKSLNDPICRAAAHYEVYWDNPDNTSDNNYNSGPFINTASGHPATGPWDVTWDNDTTGWGTWTYEDPHNAHWGYGGPGQGTRNYCVHGPSR